MMDIVTVYVAAKTTLQVVTVVHTCVKAYKKADTVYNWVRCLTHARNKVKPHPEEDFVVIDSIGRPDTDDFVLFQSDPPFPVSKRLNYTALQ